MQLNSKAEKESFLDKKLPLVLWGDFAYVLAYTGLFVFVLVGLAKNEGTKSDAAFIFADYHIDAVIDPLTNVSMSVGDPYFNIAWKSTSIAEVAVIIGLGVLLGYHGVKMWPRMAAKTNRWVTWDVAEALFVPLFICATAIMARIADGEKVMLLVMMAFCIQLCEHLWLAVIMWISLGMVILINTAWQYKNGIMTQLTFDAILAGMFVHVAYFAVRRYSKNLKDEFFFPALVALVLSGIYAFVSLSDSKSY